MKFSELLESLRIRFKKLKLFMGIEENFMETMKKGFRKGLRDNSTCFPSGRRVAPNSVIFNLNKKDYNHEIKDDEVILKEDFKGMLNDWGEKGKWKFVGPLEIDFSPNNTVEKGKIEVICKRVKPTSTPLGSAEIIVIKGNQMITKDTVFKINKAGTSIGRENSDIYLDDPNHGYISRSHAIIFCEKGKFSLKDNNSKHGTYINSVKCKNTTPLEDGDRIGLAKVNEEFAIILSFRKE